MNKYRYFSYNEILSLHFELGTFSTFALSGRGKAKNKIPDSSREASATPKKNSNQPRLNPLFEVGSDDEALGQEKPLTVLNKFSCIPNDNIRSHLRSDKLLNVETDRLCADLEKLVMYSATTQTWAGHCSAWKLFYELKTPGHSQLGQILNMA